MAKDPRGSIPEEKQALRGGLPGPGRPAFAIVTSLVLMAFVVLLLLSLAALTRVETRVAAAAGELTRARALAKLSLNIALGDLSRTAGPDRRTSARARALDPASEHALWTGIWHEGSNGGSAGDARLPAWLVSGNDHRALGWGAGEPAQAYPAGYVSPARAREAGWAELIPERGGYPPVASPWVSVEGGGAGSVGRFAFAVLDEGVKASVDVGASSVPADSAPAAAKPEHATPEMGFLEALPGETRHRIQSLEGASLLSTNPEAVMELQHDLGAQSRGVLADQAHGGLRRNLTAALQDDGAFAALLSEHGRGGSGDMMFPPVTGNSDPLANPGGPSWLQLREYYELFRGTGSVAVQQQTRERQGIFPVLTLATAWFHATRMPVPGDAARHQIRFHVLPVFAFWNPYSARLEQTTLYALWDYNNKLSGMEGLRLDLKVDGTADTITAANTEGTNPLRSAIPEAGSGGIALRPGGMLFRLEVPDIEPGEVVYLRPRSTGALSWDRSSIEAGANTLAESPPATFPLPTLTIDSSETFAATATVTDAQLYTGAGMNNGLLVLSPEVGTLYTRPMFTTRNIVYRDTDQKTKGTIDPLETSATVDTFPGSTQQFPAFGLLLVRRFGEDYLDVLAPHFGTTERPLVPWLTADDPSAPYTAPTMLDEADTAFGRNFAPSITWNSGTAFDQNIFFDILQETTGGKGYAAYSARPPVARPVLFELRAEREPVALADFASARLREDILHATGLQGLSQNSRDAVYGMAYTVGNSRAPSWLAALGERYRASWDSVPLRPGQESGNNRSAAAYDRSLLINEVLYDRFFLTGWSGSGDAAAFLEESRFSGFDGRAFALPEAYLDDYREAAGQLASDGAFNVNSDSLVAWKSVLSSTLGRSVRLADGSLDTVLGEGAFPRFSRSVYGSVDTGVMAEDSEALYGGYRGLDPDAIEELALAIIEESRERGPYHSLADFVNRNPDSADEAHRVSGPIEAAIRESGVNDFVHESGLLLQAGQDYEEFYVDDLRQPRALSGTEDLGTTVSMADQAPGLLTQIDLLKALGPRLQARSDTFRIVGKAQVLNPVTEAVTAEVRFSALVQRVPEWVGEAVEPWETPPPDSEAERFGRRFRVVNFKWQ